MDVRELTADTLAMVLAGGRGQRLEPLTAWQCKPAIPYGGHFRIIDFALSNCVNSGVRRIGVLTQYKSQTLQTHLQRGWSFLPGELGEFVEPVPPQQRTGEDWYLGTADALYQSLSMIRHHAPSRVLVLAGDHVYRADYARLLRTHVSSGAGATVGCIDVALDEASRFGVVRIDEEERITGFDEKPARPKPMPGRPDRALASMGIYVFDTEFLIEQLERDAADDASSRDFGRDVLPAMTGRGEVYAYLWTGLERESYWRDVGTLDTYHAAHMELLGASPAFELDDPRWPILTAQEQLPPARFTVTGGRLGVASESLIAGGCTVAGARVRRSVLFRHAQVGANSRIEESLLMPDVTVGAGCRIRRAIVEQDAVIPDGTSIGVDAALDRERFHVTDGGIAVVCADRLRRLDEPRRRFRWPSLRSGAKALRS